VAPYSNLTQREMMSIIKENVRPLIVSVEYTNFGVLKDAVLPLGRFNVILGANGTGKSTALRGLYLLREPNLVNEVLFLEADSSARLLVNFSEPLSDFVFGMDWVSGGLRGQGRFIEGQWQNGGPGWDVATKFMQGISLYRLQPEQIAGVATVMAGAKLSTVGHNLVSVLDRIRDEFPERFEAINRALPEWVPEFDKILFDSPGQGQKRVMLRLRGTKRSIPAPYLSDGTLLALALLTIANAPETPSILLIEEPDRGVHPRLLRLIADLLHRIAFPEPIIEDREPIQVVITTHSPYLLDCFSDHPEEVLVAQREGEAATFKKLSDMPKLREILGDAMLGEAWFTGVLGGVPSR